MFRMFLKDNDPQMGMNSLFKCVVENKEEDLQAILKKTTPRDKYLRELTDNDGNTLFHVACAAGSINAMHVLFARELVVLDAQNRDGNSALHLACAGGHVDVVRELLWRSANQTLQNGEGRKPLDLAQEHEEVKRVFQEYEDAMSHVGSSKVAEEDGALLVEPVSVALTRG